MLPGVGLRVLVRPASATRSYQCGKCRQDVSVTRSWATDAPLADEHRCLTGYPLVLVHLDGGNATVEPAPDAEGAVRRVLRGHLSGPAEAAVTVVRRLRDAGLGVVVSKPAPTEAEAVALLQERLGAVVVEVQPRDGAR